MQVVMIQRVKVRRNFFEQDSKEEIEMIPEMTLNPKVVRVLKNLQALYNEALIGFLNRSNKKMPFKKI